MPVKTTLKTRNLLLMTPDHRDALIAEKVFGWKWVTILNVSVLLHPQWFEGEIQRYGVETGKHSKKINHISGSYFIDSARRPPERYPKWPGFSKDASADYTVLQLVRQSWSHDQMEEFVRQLTSLWEHRPSSNCHHYFAGLEVTTYNPPDYGVAAVAALAVLEEK